MKSEVTYLLQSVIQRQIQALLISNQVSLMINLAVVRFWPRVPNQYNQTYITNHIAYWGIKSAVIYILESVLWDEISCNWLFTKCNWK